MGPLNLALLLGMAMPDTAISMQLVLPLAGDAERKVVVYQCEGVEQPVSVDYVNAEPNFLAIISIEGKPLILAGVVAASGARYVGGPLEWWSKGTEATLTDVRDSTVAPVTCTERSETP